MLTAPVIASSIFLCDAFRRFRITNSKNKQVINNKQVAILSLAFGLFTFGILAQQIQFLVAGSYKDVAVKNILIMLEFLIFAYFASTLILLSVLY